MTSTLGRVLGGRGARVRPPLGGFVDSLLQTFENCRPGLTDEQIRRGEAEAFFTALYEQERSQLEEAVLLDQDLLAPADRVRFTAMVDGLVRGVVIPAYTRLTAPFTVRERNDFYVTAEPLHGLERTGWAVLGFLLGAFVVWAPFIPLWEKEWFLVFVFGGLAFPELRRWFSVRGYRRQLADLVARADAEIRRTDLQLLSRLVEPELAGARQPSRAPEATEAPPPRRAERDTRRG